MSYGRNYYPNKGSGAKEGLEQKQRFISDSIRKKETSMREFAIRRDAALFASVCALNPDDLEKEYRKWLEFFAKEYDTPIPKTDDGEPKLVPIEEN